MNRPIRTTGNEYRMSTTEPTATGPTYADAIERASAALMFREPVLARTGKTARAIATRIVDALIATNATTASVVKPDEATQTTIDTQ